MGESFVADAASMGYPPDWEGGGSENSADSSVRSFMEVDSNTTEQQVVEILLDEIRGVDGYQPGIRVQGNFNPNACHSLASLDGARPDSAYLGEYYFEDMDLTFSARVLVDVLRSSGLPFFHRLNEWTVAVWDDIDDCVRVFNKSKAVDYLRAWVSPYSERTEAERLRKLVRRAQITTDHGLKPLLINIRDEGAIAAGQVVPRVLASRIKIADFDDYALAYVEASGLVKIIPLPDAAQAAGECRLPLCTRTGNYYLRCDALCSDVASTRLRVDAFKIIASRKPSEVACFKVDEIGTIHQPHIHRIDLFANVEGIDPLTLPDILACTNAMRVPETSSRFAKVYLTSGPHPFEPSTRGQCTFVTTPQFYCQALEALHKCGMQVNF